MRAYMPEFGDFSLFLFPKRRAAAENAAVVEHSPFATGPFWTGYRKNLCLPSLSCRLGNCYRRVFPPDGNGSRTRRAQHILKGGFVSVNAWVGLLFLW